jgi:hypothetical protein
MTKRTASADRKSSSKGAINEYANEHSQHCHVYSWCGVRQPHTNSDELQHMLGSTVMLHRVHLACLHNMRLSCSMCLASLQLCCNPQIRVHYPRHCSFKSTAHICIPSAVGGTTSLKLSLVFAAGHDHILCTLLPLWQHGRSPSPNTVCLHLASFT